MGALDSGTYMAQQKALHGGRVVLDTSRDASASATSAFKSAIAAAKNARTSIPSVPAMVTPSPKVIDLQPGVYLVNEARALLGSENPSAQIRGLHFRGAGAGTTTIVFTPGAAGIMASSTWWQQVRFTGITFACATAAAGSTFLQLDNTSDATAGQDYIFTDCSWVGPWKYAVDLKGVNNASEFRFIGCSTESMQNDGAFLHTSATGSSDQMLNYWFYGFKHWSTSAPVVDMAKGGSVHIFGLDASDWGKSETGTLFALRGHAHARGVTQFHAQGVRLENKSANSKILYSEWDDGNVTLQVDMGSQADVHTYGTMIDLQLGNANGAIYRIHDSVMAGKINVQTGSGSWSHSAHITIEDTTWLQAQRPSDVIVRDMGGMDLGAPVSFVRCRPEGSSSALEATGFAVWDATLGRGQMGQSVTPRTVRLVDVWGGLSSASVATVHLPVGALITGFRVLSPAGTANDADGGTFTLKTSSGTQIGSAVVGNMAGGFFAGGLLAKPFACTTATLATVKVASSDLTSTPRDTVVLIDGHW